MNPTGGYTVNEPWQSGASTFAPNFQQGTLGFPQTGEKANRELGTADHRKNHSVMTIKSPLNKKEKSYLDHHQQFIWRILDDNTNAVLEFDAHRKALINRINQKDYRRDAARNREIIGSTPVGHYVDTQELNLWLCEKQIEGAYPTSEDLVKVIRPIGISVTPSESMMTLETPYGVIEEITVEGPAQMHNCFGRGRIEGDQAWARWVLVPIKPGMCYRINSDNDPIYPDFKLIKNQMTHIWQVELLGTEREPERFFGPRSRVNKDGKVDETWELGINIRLGVLQHVYKANHLPDAFSILGSKGKHAGEPNVDILTAISAPTVRLFVDINDNGPY